MKSRWCGDVVRVYCLLFIRVLAFTLTIANGVPVECCVNHISSLCKVPSSPERPLTPSFQVIKDTLPWGFLGGSVNALAIVLVIKAMDDIDYVVANTLSQTSIFVAGLWGWLLFSEFSGVKAVGSFFLSSAILVSGACIVGYFGTTK